MNRFAKIINNKLDSILTTEDTPVDGGGATWVVVPWEVSHLPVSDLYYDRNTIRIVRTIEISCSTGVIAADGVDECVVQFIDRAIPEVISEPLHITVNGEDHLVVNEPLIIGPTAEPGNWLITVTEPGIKATPAMIVAVKESPV